MRRISSTGEHLVKAIQQFFPARYFSSLKLSQKQKNGVWKPQQILWVGCLLMWHVESTLTDRFESVMQLLKGLFPKWLLGKSYQGWCDAQLGWMRKMQPGIAKRLRGQMELGCGRHWLRETWCAFAADGSRYECARTMKNKSGLGCAGKERTGPQLFLTALWHMGTGLPWDYRIGPGTASERRHLEEMLGDLPPRSLIVADAGFTGYDLLRRIIDSGQSFLVRVGANVHLLKELGYLEQECESTVYLWPSDQRDRPPIVLRLLVRRRGQQKMHLITNVLDEGELTEDQVVLLYEMRWGVEVFFRSCKQTMQRRKILSRTPETAEAELHWTMISIWLLGLMSVSRIISRGKDPLSWSVAKSLQCIRQAMRDACSHRKRGLANLNQALSNAVKDTYVRKGCKKAHDWPHKKRENPPGEPNIRPANESEVRKAQKIERRQAA